MIGSLIFSGCASQPKSDQRMQALQMKLKKQRSQLDDLKERNLVLEKRVYVKRVSIDDDGESIGAAPLTSEPPTPLPNSFAKQVPSKPSVLPVNFHPKAVATTISVTPVSVTSEKSGEHYLYSKILDSYRRKIVMISTVPPNFF